MTEEDQHPAGEDSTTTTAEILGTFAPEMARLTEDVLFGEVWNRANLSAKDRSLITVACLTTNGATAALRHHLMLARENGNTEAELVEALTHLAFYAGWPRAMSALALARELFADTPSPQ